MEPLQTTMSDLLPPVTLMLKPLESLKTTMQDIAKTGAGLDEIDLRKGAILPKSKNSKESKALSREGFATDFQAQLQGLLSGIGTDTLGSLFSQAVRSILSDIQARAATDLSQMITGGLFGKSDGNGGGLKGGLLSSIFGALFSGLFGGGAKIGKVGTGIGAAGLGGIGLGMVPGRASGGPVSSGGLYMVGEQGPELFVPGSAGSIIPNSRNRGTTRGANTTINNNNITVNEAPSRASFRQQRSRREFAEKSAALVAE
jgi:hypothetical protein